MIYDVDEISCRRIKEGKPIEPIYIKYHPNLYISIQQLCMTDKFRIYMFCWKVVGTKRKVGWNYNIPGRKKSCEEGPVYYNEDVLERFFRIKDFDTLDECYDYVEGQKVELLANILEIQ